jgi:hypothetical protein
MAELDKDTEGILLDIPVPDHLSHCKNVRKFAWPHMVRMDHRSKMEADPDSDMGKALVSRGDKTVMGKALVSRDDKEKEEALHDLTKPFAGGLYPNSFGIYSPSDKRSAATIRTGVSQDEKYHWYKIGAFDFSPNSFLWGFYWIAHVDLTTAYTNADGLPGYNVWESWISVKYTGPAYVKGSTQKNGVFIDKVILVKPEEAKK